MFMPLGVRVKPLSGALMTIRRTVGKVYTIHCLSDLFELRVLAILQKSRYCVSNKLMLSKNQGIL